MPPEEQEKARKQLTSLCVNADPDNWPETEKQLHEAFSMKDLEAINWNSEERKQNAEKWRKRFEQDENVAVARRGGKIAGIAQRIGIRTGENRNQPEKRRTD